MSRLENPRKATLGILLILALLATPWSATARLLVWEADDSGMMQPGDPEGGDRTFPDTPIDQPGGQTGFIPDGPDGGDDVPDAPEIRLLPILRDYWLIVTPMLKPGTTPYLLTR